MLKKITLNKAIGIVLLTPPLISCFLFLLSILDNNSGDIAQLDNLSRNWTGDYYVRYGRGNSDDGSGGYTSAAPIYLGLMAIAGSLLLRNEK